MKIAQEVTAWLSDNSPSTLESLADPATLSLARFVYTDANMSTCGWRRVGVAMITLELPSHDVMRDMAIDSLRAEITAVRANAQAMITHLEGRIANLLALPMSAEAEQ